MAGEGLGTSILLSAVDRRLDTIRGVIGQQRRRLCMLSYDLRTYDLNIFWENCNYFGQIEGLETKRQTVFFGCHAEAEIQSYRREPTHHFQPSLHDPPETPFTNSPNLAPVGARSEYANLPQLSRVQVLFYFQL